MKNLGPIILKKAQHMGKREWGGYYTSVEIIKLVKAGVKPNHMQDVEMAKTNKKKGISAARWFYFTVSNELRELFAKYGS
jgi:hypothetical protein